MSFAAWSICCACLGFNLCLFSPSSMMACLMSEIVISPFRRLSKRTVHVFHTLRLSIFARFERAFSSTIISAWRCLAKMSVLASVWDMFSPSASFFAVEVRVSGTSFIVIHPSSMAFPMVWASACPSLTPSSKASFLTSGMIITRLKSFFRRCSLFIWAKWMRGPASETMRSDAWLLVFLPQIFPENCGIPVNGDPFFF